MKFTDTNKKSSAIYICALCVLLFHCYSLYLFHRYELDDYVYLRGDTWEYQSLGTNISLGHGYKHGALESFEVYKFNPGRISDEMYEFFMDTREYSFYRTPGYPVFLAGIYKIFGIHPQNVKLIQVFMMALVACLMPIVAVYYWPRFGLMSGTIASFFFIRSFCPDPSLILTEPFVIFVLFIWAAMLMMWEQKTTRIATFLLGLMSGVMLLVKGITIFIPFIFFVLMVRILWGKKGLLWYVTAFLLGLSLMILPWSTYASVKAGKPIMLSTQAAKSLLDSNNEGTIYTGGWNPEWRKDAHNKMRVDRGDLRYLYNRLSDQEYSPMRKMAIFLSRNIKSVPLLIKNKIQRAIEKRSVFICLVFMLLYYYTYFVKHRDSDFSQEKMPVFPLVYFLNLFLITVIFYGEYRFVQVFTYFFLLPAAYFPFYIFIKAKRDI